MIELTDALGVTHRFTIPPRRIVSLVPSTTETVYALGAEAKLVGVTRYCVRPPEARRLLASVGGTKAPRVDRIRELEPGLVLANQEENRESDVRAIQTFAPVYVAFPRDVPSAIAEIRKLSVLLDRPAEGGHLAEEIERALEGLRERRNEGRRFRYVYLIWKNPFMAAGAGTFIDALLSEAGGVNALRPDAGRYPEISLRDIEADRPEAVLLSSEPYPFGERDAAELLDQLEDRSALEHRVHLVDGQALSWHGARMREGLPYLGRLVGRILASASRGG